MSQLNLKPDQHLPSVEDFAFEPIRGYPMLHWKGKRPFRSTQYYPAQLKEVHGEATRGWLNKIFWGDNLQVMSHLLKTYRGQVDLVYIDPPFDSKADYKKKISLKGKTIGNDTSAFEEKQYTDIWSNDEYLQFMYERLILTRELMSERGSLFLHCDWHKSHFLRCILDELFSYEGLVNEIIWQRTSAGKSSTNNLPKNTDTIYWFSKSKNYTFNSVSIPFSEKDIASFNKNDDDGRGPYNTQPIISPNRRENLIYDYVNKEGRVYLPPNNGWRFNIDRMRMLEEDKRLVFSESGIREKNYLFERSEKGKQISNLWADISGNTMAYSSESVSYPTQKPAALLQRIIQASSNPGDLVFDCFMGSGTTQAVAMKLGRRFIGADINLGAIQTTTKRLLGVAADLRAKQIKAAGELPLIAAEPAPSYGEEVDTSIEKQITEYYTGFEVFNVNHYDVFRNPVEAKDLLIKALEIQPLPGNTLYDGEKDGRMVKIMSVNRLATRADLNELITGFDYKAFEKRNEASPGKPVEHLTLVCMGHEPDLGAYLREQLKISGLNLDVEVVDILRDKSNLEFKRDAEAEIAIEGNKLVIRQFYPMNLLQKLSLMKENVEDWRELVESVMVDFHYDGAVFEPSEVDVPSGNALVRGIYPIPADAGRIRVKITDLLSESLETTVQHG